MGKSRELSPTLLAEIQKLDFDFNSTKMSIADAEIRKLDMHATLSSIRKKFKAFELKIARKYGRDACIDIRTGVITKKKDAENSDNPV